MIGALRWITYINPLRYGFEGVLVNEFRTLRGACANLVPQGPGYENVSLANQVCASIGARPGESAVDGNAFVSLSYGYHYGELWKVSASMLSSLLCQLISCSWDRRTSGSWSCSALRS